MTLVFRKTNIWLGNKEKSRLTSGNVGSGFKPATSTTESCNPPAPYLLCCSGADATARSCHTWLQQGPPAPRLQPSMQQSPPSTLCSKPPRTDLLSALEDQQLPTCISIRIKTTHLKPTYINLIFASAEEMGFL